MLKEVFKYVGNSAVGQEVIHSIPGILAGDALRTITIQAGIGYFASKARKKGVGDMSSLVGAMAMGTCMSDPEFYLLNKSPLRKTAGGRVEQIPVDEAVYNRLEVLAERANFYAGIAKGTVRVAEIGALLLAAEAVDKVKDLKDRMFSLE